MTDDCNRHILEQARRNIAERYVQTYTVNAILRGEWDNGELVGKEIERLLKQPPISENEDE